MHVYIRLQKGWRWFIEIKILTTLSPPQPPLPLIFYLDSVKNTTWPWLTSCWMIRSWQPGSTGSGRSWTPCWFRISMSSSSRTPRPPLKAPPRDSRNHLPAPLLKILVENSQDALPFLPPATLQDVARAYVFPWKENWDQFLKHELPL